MSSVTTRPDDGTHRRQEDTSASAIQARVRGMQARRLDNQTHHVSDSTTGREGKRRRSSRQEEAAAVRIGAAARGHLARKRAEEGVEQELCGLQTNEAGEELEATGAQQHQRDTEDFATASGAPMATPAAAPRAEAEAKTGAAAGTPAGLEGLAEVEALGDVGVRAFFDSLGLGACTNRLREGNGGIDGAELARIARSPNPDAELLAAGVSARLHRVKVLSALGVGVGVTQVASSATPLPGVGGGGGLARVTTVAVLHMVRQLRKEQDVVADALCKKSSGVELGQNLPPPRAEDRLSGGASGGSKETIETGAGASFVSLVLPEIEEVLSTQLQLSSQVGEAICPHDFTHITVCFAVVALPG